MSKYYTIKEDSGTPQEVRLASCLELNHKWVYSKYVSFKCWKLAIFLNGETKEKTLGETIIPFHDIKSP